MSIQKTLTLTGKVSGVFQIILTDLNHIYVETGHKTGKAKYRDSEMWASFHLYKNPQGVFAVNQSNKPYITRGLGIDAPPTYAAAIVDAVTSEVNKMNLTKELHEAEVEKIREQKASISDKIAEATAILGKLSTEYREIEKKEADAVTAFKALA